MGINAYKLLGLSEKQVADNNNAEELDNQIKMQLKRILDTIHEQINKELASEKSAIEKINKIDSKIQEMFLYRFSYMKIMSEEARENYKKGTMSTVEDDLKNMREYLNSLTKIEHRKSKNGTRIPSNAYQILGTTDGNKTLTDKSVSIKTLALLKISISKEPPKELEDLEEMLLSVQRTVWAYYKLNTSEKRKSYEEEIKYQRLSQDSRKEDVFVGNIQPRENTKPHRVILNPKEPAENRASIIDIGKLVNTNNSVDEGYVGQYLFEKNSNGQRRRRVIFSKIDMEKLQSDPKYAEFVLSIMSDRNIMLARKYLGGYIGDINITKAMVDDRIEEIPTLKFNLKYIAIAKKFQRQERQRKAMQNGIPKTPNDDNDEQEV